MNSSSSHRPSLDVVRNLMNKIIKFNAFLGLEITELSPEGKARLRVPFREEYMGDPIKKIVHGGILATLIDVTGGATTFAALDLNRVIGVNTIDMRIDYLRPGSGLWFEGTGTVIRRGNRIVVTHVDVHNDEGVQIAMGTATYNVVLRDEQPVDKQEWGNLLEEDE